MLDLITLAVRYSALILLISSLAVFKTSMRSSFLGVSLLSIEKFDIVPETSKEGTIRSGPTVSLGPLMVYRKSSSESV